MELTNNELGKSTHQSILMKYLFSVISEYDFNAIYQRGSNVWTLKMKQNLICSILCGVPVGWIHLIRHKTKRDYSFVCDGKKNQKIRIYMTSL